MLIVIEGPDRAGKSTLAERIVDRVGSGEVFHRGPPTEHPLTEYLVPLQDYTPSRDHVLVLDRWHVGELVYGEILRGGSSMRHVERRYIDMFLLTRGALMVHMTDDVDRLLERRTDEDLVDEVQHARSARMFNDLIESPILEHHTANLRTVDVSRMLSDAKALDGGAIARSLPSYIGIDHPFVLYVGDKGGTAGPDHVTPFTPYQRSSGDFLARALGDSMAQKCGIINSEGIDLTRVMDILKPVRVVALGGEASKRLSRADIAHGRVPHPQWVRRFKWFDLNRYSHLLTSADTGTEVTSW